MEAIQQLFNLGHEMLEEKRYDEAIGAYRRIVELDPRAAAAWYDLGLVYKLRKEWSESRECNWRSFELQPDDESTCWNLGIAATALRDWETARKAWLAVGMTIEPGDGPPLMKLGHTPVRLNSDTGGEVVWAQGVGPVRARLLNVPFPASGYRWGDVVLHDGAPTGERISGGRRYSVFNVLELLDIGPHRAIRAHVLAPRLDDYEALAQLCSSNDAGCDDWTRTRPLTSAESYDVANVDTTDPDAPGWRTQRTVALAASPEMAERLLEEWARGAPGRERLGHLHLDE